MILVTTAGKVGSAAAIELAASETSVRVLVRDPDRHHALRDAGVELVQGDLDDAGSVTAALDGVSAIVLVSTAIPRQELGVVDAAVAAGADFIVKVTSKASLDSPIERRRGQSVIEAGLAESGIPHTLLRANAYMQNFLALAPAISAGGFASSAADGRVGLVDARDVGAAAAAIAARPAGHVGATYWLTGPELLSYSQAAAILTDVLGLPVAFAARSRSQDEAAMIAAGVPAAIAAQNAQAFSLIADGDAEWLSDDLAIILGRKPRSFADFAADYRSALEAR